MTINQGVKYELQLMIDGGEGLLIARFSSEQEVRELVEIAHPGALWACAVFGGPHSPEPSSFPRGEEDWEFACAGGEQVAVMVKRIEFTLNEYVS